MIIVLEDRLWKKVFLWWLPREKSILAKWRRGWNTWKNPLLSPEWQEQGNLLLKLLQRLSRSRPRSLQAPASGVWLGAFNSISTSIAPAHCAHSAPPWGMFPPPLCPSLHSSDCSVAFNSVVQSAPITYWLVLFLLHWNSPQDKYSNMKACSTVNWIKQCQTFKILLITFNVKLF